jgi:D-3-phosphoglycerate dehydrogenase
VVVTPHLGASTIEAQDKAGTAIAEMVRLALRGEFVPYAVNVSAGTEVPEAIRPFMSLAERLGGVLTGLAEGAIRAIDCQYLGRVAEVDTRVLTLAALKGSLAGVVHEPISFVNAPVIAAERGIALSETKSTVSRDYVNLLALRAETDEGEVAVAGTLVGKRDGERLVQVFDFDVDMAPAGNMTFLLYEDRPGVIGKVGTMLGDAGVNIAGAQVARKAAGGLALMAVTTDTQIPQDVLDRIAPTALPRSSIVISDEPLSAETNYRTEFVAVLSNQPQGGFITRKPTVNVAGDGFQGGGGFPFWGVQGNTRRRGWW